MKLAEIASKIHAHLARMEAEQPKKDRAGGGYWNAHASAVGNGVSVRYVGYQGSTHLPKKLAEAYLWWLDAGNSGRHFEFERKVPKAAPEVDGYVYAVHERWEKSGYIPEIRRVAFTRKAKTQRLAAPDPAFAYRTVINPGDYAMTPSDAVARWKKSGTAELEHLLAKVAERKKALAQVPKPAWEEK